jgi:hypothetical protein
MPGGGPARKMHAAVSFLLADRPAVRLKFTEHNCLALGGGVKMGVFNARATVAPSYALAS